MKKACERHRQYAKSIAWQQYINYSTIVIGLACYLGSLSDQWQTGALLVVGTLLILAGVMRLVRLRAEQQLKMGKKALSPPRLFP